MGGRRCDTKVAATLGQRELPLASSGPAHPYQKRLQILAFRQPRMHRMIGALMTPLQYLDPSPQIAGSATHQALVVFGAQMK